jgi:hypothetical protein
MRRQTIRLTEVADILGVTSSAPTRSPRRRASPLLSPRMSAVECGADTRYRRGRRGGVRRSPGASSTLSILLRSQGAAITAARVPLSYEGNLVQRQGFSLPITGSLLLIGLGLLHGPFEMPFSSGRRPRPESVCELT